MGVPRDDGVRPREVQLGLGDLEPVLGALAQTAELPRVPVVVRLQQSASTLDKTGVASSSVGRKEVNSYSTQTLNKELYMSYPYIQLCTNIWRTLTRINQTALNEKWVLFG